MSIIVIVCGRVADPKKKSTKTGPYAYIMLIEGRENPEK